MEAAGRGSFPGSLSVPGDARGPAPGPLHPSDTETQRQAQASRDAAHVRGSCWATVACHVPSGDSRVPDTTQAGPSANPWPRRCRRTPRGPELEAALTSGNLPEPRRSPSRVRAAHRPGEAQHPLLGELHGQGALPGRAAAWMLRRRPGTHLWVQKSRGGLREGGSSLQPPPRAGQTPVQPALRLEGAPLLPPLHPPPPPPGRSPALPWGDAAGSSPSLLGARGPPAPAGRSPRSISPP